MRAQYVGVVLFFSLASLPLGVLWLLLAFFGFLLLRSCGSDRTAAAATNEQRVAYLNSLGWQVAPEPVETLSLTLPKDLEEPYQSYNVLQRAQGFDLEPCCGKTVERCTYTVKNHPSGKVCQADLNICGGESVAGDILCTGDRAAAVESTLLLDPVCQSGRDVYANYAPEGLDEGNVACAARELGLVGAPPAGITAEQSANAKIIMDEVIVPKFQSLLAGEATAQEVFDAINEKAVELFGADGIVTGLL